MASQVHYKMVAMLMTPIIDAKIEANLRAQNCQKDKFSMPMQCLIMQR